MEKIVQVFKLEEYRPAKSLTLICGGRVVSISFMSIFRISRSGNLVQIYTADSMYQSHRSLQDLLHDLPAHQLFRVNRCHIFGLGHVTCFTRRKVFIGGQCIAVASYGPKQFYYFENMFDKLLAMYVDLPVSC